MVERSRPLDLQVQCNQEGKPMSGTRVQCYIVMAVALLGSLGSLAAGPAAPVAARSAAAVPSVGCGQPWTPEANIHGTLAFGGLQRLYLLHIPLGYNPTTAVPLILNLPGTAMDEHMEALLTHMSTTADQDGFVVVYPVGTQFPLTWNTGQPGNPAAGVDDVGFLNALVDVLEGELCVDMTRIGMTGLSVGGSMVYRIACSNLTWLAAIAPVSAAFVPCSLGHPTPLLAFHGVLDPLVPYAAALAEVTSWAQTDGCPNTGTVGFTKADVVQQILGPCTSGADVQFYSVLDGGHAWPGGLPLTELGLPYLGYTTQAIDASALVGTFVATHPLL
jgi:polyhydroxybutyrate depolymerase